MKKVEHEVKSLEAQPVPPVQYIPPDVAPPVAPAAAQPAVQGAQPGVAGAAPVAPGQPGVAPVAPGQPAVPGAPGAPVQQPTTGPATQPAGPPGAIVVPDGPVAPAQPGQHQDHYKPAAVVGKGASIHGPGPAEVGGVDGVVPASAEGAAGVAAPGAAVPGVVGGPTDLPIVEDHLEGDADGGTGAVIDADTSPESEYTGAGGPMKAGHYYDTVEAPAAGAVIPHVTEPVEGDGVDVDTQMPYGNLEPFGREDTAQELTESSIGESNSMVDQMERAEVAEEKRAVFRALTRLRGAAITSFDGIARTQTSNIDEYNKVHKWRKTHPLHHLAAEEADITKWAFPDNS